MDNLQSQNVFGVPLGAVFETTTPGSTKPNLFVIVVFIFFVRGLTATQTDEGMKEVYKKTTVHRRRKMFLEEETTAAFSTIRRSTSAESNGVNCGNRIIRSGQR